MSTIAEKLTLLQNTKADIKSAIEEKGQTIIDGLPFSKYGDKIREIQTGTDTSDATATPSDILLDKTAYGPDGKITGTIRSYEGGTVVPEKDNTVFRAPLYLSGDLIIKGDNRLVPENIKSGVTIFNVPGTYQGTDTSDATATASDILSGKTAYGASGKLTGTIATKTSSDLTASGETVTVPAGYYASDATKNVAVTTQATPTISVSSSGLISASSSQSAGYVNTGTKNATEQLTTQSGTTITPGTSTKTAVSSGRYTTGTVYVAGSRNLTASNIKSGVSIFGVTGTLTAGYKFKVYQYGSLNITASATSSGVATITFSDLLSSNHIIAAVVVCSAIIVDGTDYLKGIIMFSDITPFSSDGDYGQVYVPRSDVSFNMRQLAKNSNSGKSFSVKPLTSGRGAITSLKLNGQGMLVYT